MRDFWYLLLKDIRTDFASRERWLSPLLFSMVTLLLFFFAFGEIPTELQSKLQIAQLFLSVFLTLQLAYLRIFAADEADDAFTLLRTQAISGEAWFLAKLSVVVVYSLLVAGCTQVMSIFFNGGTTTSLLLDFSHILLATLAVLGPAALGVLLAALMIRSNARQLVFPLLYFPLVVPVLLAAVQSYLTLLDGQSLSSIYSSWLGLLVIFDLVYVTVCTLLFAEFIRAE